MDFSFLIDALNQVKGALAAVSFDTWYVDVIIFASALASEFLCSLVRNVSAIAAEMDKSKLIIGSA